MGDENTPLDSTTAPHLLRRTCFGAPAEDVQKLLNKTPNTPYTRGQAADLLLNFKPGTFKPTGRYIENVQTSWIKYMLKIKSRLKSATQSPLQEKLVLFWHDHFATSDAKVENPSLMAFQNQTLRKLCMGNLKVLVKTIGKDPAMIEFLDTVRNFKDQPNENYARELQELFTLGVFDAKGKANYEQADIVQIARCFSGWSYDNRPTKAVFHDYDHDFEGDFPDRGPKAVYLGAHGFGAMGYDLTQNGEGAPEIDTVIEAIFQHQDSDGQNTVARRIARRLFEYFAHGGFGDAIVWPSDVVQAVDEVVTASGFGEPNWSIHDLVRAILVHDRFYDTAPPVSSPSSKKSVKWPVDYAVSTLRLLGVTLTGQSAYIAGGSYDAIVDHLANMGQELLEPPSVFGWDWETSWINSATLLARANFARDITSSRGNGKTHFHPEKLVNLGLTDPAAIVDAVADALGVKDDLSSAEKQDLQDYLTELGAAIDLHDYDFRNRKLNGLFALVLQSPAFQLH